MIAPEKYLKIFPHLASPTPMANELLGCVDWICVHWYLPGGFPSLKPTPNVFSLVEKSDSQ